MKQDEFKKVLFKGAISMIACDGNIHSDEIDEIKTLVQDSLYFIDFDYETGINKAKDELAKDGVKFVGNFLTEFDQFEFTEKQRLMMIEVLIKIVEADKQIDPSELRFLHIIKEKLKVNDETIIAKFPTHLNLLLDMQNYGINISWEQNIDPIDMKEMR